MNVKQDSQLNKFIEHAEEPGWNIYKDPCGNLYESKDIPILCPEVTWEWSGVLIYVGLDQFPALIRRYTSDKVEIMYEKGGIEVLRNNKIYEMALEGKITSITERPFEPPINFSDPVQSRRYLDAMKIAYGE